MVKLMMANLNLVKSMMGKLILVTIAMAKLMVKVNMVKLINLAF
jgi:hypothetical protein